MADLTPARADQLTLRAHLAFLCWLAVAGGLFLLGLVMVVLGLAGAQPLVAVVGGLVAAWLGGYVVACAAVVWSYRRWIGPYVAAGDPASRLRAEALTRVRLLILPVDRLAGVHLAGAEPNRLARLVNSPWVVVGHLGAIGLAVVGVAIE